MCFFWGISLSSIWLESLLQEGPLFGGQAGASDTTLILTTTSGGKLVYGRGRDLAEFECAMDFDTTTCRWSDLGRPCDVHGSATRKAIRAALKAGKQTPQEIADAANLDYDLCAKTLQRMAEGG